MNATDAADHRREPGVSVVVPHYGDPNGTLPLLAMLQQQRYDGPLQVIVADDASPEPFPAVPGVELVRRERNGGFGSTVNSGASRARHDLLLILNSDLEIPDDFVRDLVREGASWQPAVLSPRVVSPTGHATWTGRHFPTVRHQFVEWLTPLARWRDRRLLHEWVGHDTSVTDDAVAVVDWVVGAAMMVPTEHFRAVGGFDERFFMNSEEVDLQRRLRAIGIPSVVLPAPVAVHEGGGSSDAGLRRAWLVRSRLAYADKWGSRRHLQAALTVATALNLLWNAGRRALGRPVHPWRTARQELDLINPGRTP